MYGQPMYKVICYHNTCGHPQAPPHNTVCPGTTRARTTHPAPAPVTRAQPAPLGRHQMARTTARWPATRGAQRHAQQGAHTPAPLTRRTERGYQLKTPDLHSFGDTHMGGWPPKMVKLHKLHHPPAATPLLVTIQASKKKLLCCRWDRGQWMHSTGQKQKKLYKTV